MEVISNGWIKLHREILDHWVYDDPEKLKIWITLLSKASHKKRKVPINYQVIDIKPGELIFGTIKFAEAIGVSRDKLYKTVKMFEKDGMIEYDTTTYKNKFSIIRILNWEKYQNQKGKCPTNQEEEGIDHKGNIRGSEGGSEEDKSKADGEHTESKTNKNVKNVKKVKEINKYADDINSVYDFWIDKLSDVNDARLTKNQKETILTKLKKWNKEKLFAAINNYNEIYRSDYYYSHSFTMYKFIKQSNGAPRFLEGLDQEYDGDIYKDYLNWIKENQGNLSFSKDKEKERRNAAKKRLEERDAKYG